jgi:ribose 1,5-bisphosphokinase
MAHASSSIPIGPGTFVAIVGPSGAGKDTLLSAAQAQLGGKDGFAFSRRRITRDPSDTERNESISWKEYRRAVKAGDMALAWEAHGLGYIIPRVADHEISTGRTVVANISRGAVAGAKARYARCFVVHIDAPLETRANRLAGRLRESASEILLRLERIPQVSESHSADLVIDNGGSLDQGVTALVSFLLETASLHRAST